jgi:hypothetical protein
VPAAELGSWMPGLISIDGYAQLALTRDFADARIFATTWNDEHIVALAPYTERTAALQHSDSLNAPPPGLHEH